MDERASAGPLKALVGEMDFGDLLYRRRAFSDSTFDATHRAVRSEQRRCRERATNAVYLQEHSPPAQGERKEVGPALRVEEGGANGTYFSRIDRVRSCLVLLQRPTPSPNAHPRRAQGSVYLRSRVPARSFEGLLDLAGCRSWPQLSRLPFVADRYIG